MIEASSMPPFDFLTGPILVTRGMDAFKRVQRAAHGSAGFSAGWFSLQPGGSPSPGLPTTPPPERFGGKTAETMRTCGTAAIAWASRAPPPLGQPPANVRIEFAYLGDEDHYRGYDGHVVTCRGYILYYLQPTRYCAGYCAL